MAPADHTHDRGRLLCVTDARIEQIKAMIRGAFALYRTDLRNHRVVFFGSRVAGTSRPRSDFDVGIDGTAPVDVVLLDRIRTTLDDLPTLYRIDLVDLATVTEPVRAEMLRHIEIIL